MKKREKTKICKGKSEIRRAYLLCSEPHRSSFHKKAPVNRELKRNRSVVF